MGGGEGSRLGHLRSWCSPEAPRASLCTLHSFYTLSGQDPWDEQEGRCVFSSGTSGFVSSLGDGEEETLRWTFLSDRLGQPSLFRWGKLRPREDSGAGPCAGVRLALERGFGPALGHHPLPCGSQGYSEVSPNGEFHPLATTQPPQSASSLGLLQAADQSGCTRLTPEFLVQRSSLKVVVTMRPGCRTSGRRWGWVGPWGCLSGYC